MNVPDRGQPGVKVTPTQHPVGGVKNRIENKLINFTQNTKSINRHKLEI